MERDPAPAHPTTRGGAASLVAVASRAGRGRSRHSVSSRFIRTRNATIGTSEMTSNTVAMADPKPINWASLMARVRDENRQQLQAVLAAVDDVDDVERAQGLDRRDDDDDDVDRHHHPEDDARICLDAACAVDGCRLTKRRVDALQARQIQNHDVSDVPPARSHKRRPEVDGRIAEPVRRRQVPRSAGRRR